jgi:DNA mismatch repair protein MSH4
MSASQAPGPRQSISCIGSRPGTRLSRRTAPSVIGGLDSQQIICAISEGRGVSPTVGLAFVNISTAEAVISQICDSQFYVRTCNKIQVFEPTEILVMSTAGQPNAKSKMISIIEENSIGSKIVSVDRKYWSETSGLEYIQQLSFSEDLEALKIAIDGSYFAICCLAAVCLGAQLFTNIWFITIDGFLSISGSEIHKLQDVSYILLSFSPHQIPAI